MKSLLATLLLTLFASSVLTAQNTVIKPTMLDMRPGYVTINELTTGIGLSEINVPYSSAFYGFTTIHGYQVDSKFFIGVGAGLSFFSNGTLLPLFIDLRYNYFRRYNFTSYFFGDGGFLFNINGNINNNKLYVNPGAGIRYDFNHNFAGNFGIGLMTQQSDHRDSFINFKLGFTFKPIKK
jgi:hypothetical protein